MEGKGTRDLQGLLDHLDLRDPQDQPDHRAMDLEETQVQRERQEFLEPRDHLEKPVLKENRAYQHQSQVPQDLQGPLGRRVAEVYLVCLDLWENVSLVFLDLMVNQGSQELDFLGLQDLKEIKVSQEQKDHLVVLGNQESQAVLENQATQEPRENQHSPSQENRENLAFQEKEAIPGKVEKLDSLGLQASLELQERMDLMGLQETQDSLDRLEQKEPRGGAHKDPRVSKDFPA